MGLDYIDKELIKKLIGEGRQNLKNIKIEIIKSELQEISQSGIRKRFERIKNNKTVKVQGNININKLKYHCALIFTIVNNGNSLNELIDTYSKCRNVFLLARVSGQYNLLVGIIEEDFDKLHLFIHRYGPGNLTEIAHSEILFISTFKLPKFFPVDLFNSETD
jgi:DNA-binding Lrp family transcriptional regulator